MTRPQRSSADAMPGAEWARRSTSSSLCLPSLRRRSPRRARSAQCRSCGSIATVHTVGAANVF